MDKLLLYSTGETDLVGASKRMINLLFTRQPEPVGAPVVFEGFKIVNNRIPRVKAQRGIGIVALTQSVFLSGTVVEFNPSQNRIYVDFDVQYDNLVSTPLEPNCSFKTRGYLEVERVGPGQYKLKGFFLQHDNFYRIDHTWMMGIGLPQFFINIIDPSKNIYPEETIKQTQETLAFVNQQQCFQPLSHQPAVCAGSKSRLTEQNVNAQQQNVDAQITAAQEETKRIQTVVQQLSQCNADKVTISPLISENREIIKQLPVIIQQLKTQYQPIADRLMKFKQTSDQLNESITATQNDINNTLNQNDAAQISETELKEQQSMLKERLQGNTLNLTSLSTQLQEINVNLKNLNARTNDQPVAAYVDLQRKLNGLNGDILKTRQQLQDLQTQKKSVQDTIVIQRDVKKTLDAIAERQLEIADLKDYHDLYNSAIFKQYADFAFLVFFIAFVVAVCYLIFSRRRPSKVTITRLKH